MGALGHKSADWRRQGGMWPQHHLPPFLPSLGKSVKAEPVWEENEHGLYGGILGLCVVTVTLRGQEDICWQPVLAPLGSLTVKLL